MNETFCDEAMRASIFRALSSLSKYRLDAEKARTPVPCAFPENDSVLVYSQGSSLIVRQTAEDTSQVVDLRAR